MKTLGLVNNKGRVGRTNASTPLGASRTGDLFPPPGPQGRFCLSCCITYASLNNAVHWRGWWLSSPRTLVSGSRPWRNAR